MKSASLVFLILLVGFSVITGKAQQAVSKPLKLSLQIKEKDLCVGKPFTILGRLENTGETEQIIDKKSLWRFVDKMGPIEGTLFDKNLPETKNPSNTAGFPNWDSKMNLQRSETKLKLKPTEFYEDELIIEASDKFFSQPGTYLFSSAYKHFFELSGKLSSGDTISSNDLKFTLRDC